jgi:sugar O-acyltransferase (sialic acid O-acetyltransferase NeuD family)
MKKAIIGSGGFAREVMASMEINIPFFIDDKYLSGKTGERSLSTFDPFEFEVVVAIADPRVRESIVNKLPKETRFFTFIHPSAIIHLGPYNEISVIGEGSIVLEFCRISCNARVGKHAHLNWGTIIGHDAVIGDYLTTAPNVGVMGNNIIGDRVCLGVGSNTREKLSICSDVTIGLGAGVVKSINEPGTYVGVPCQKVSTK